MDLKVFFSEPHRIRFQYADKQFCCFLREPTDIEYLQFRKKLQNVTVANGRVLSSEAALGAPIFLFDIICARVEVQNGDGAEEVADFKDILPPDIKCAVIDGWQSRFEIIKITPVLAKPEGTE